VRALLSVYDKSGVVDLARGLAAAGWDLVSSGNTARAIAADDIAVTDVADLTGAPAILGHRVMTLHPKVHGGLLADRDDPEHQADMADHDISPIDLLVSNLYPFGSNPAAFSHGGSAGAVDLIDIGGPAMIRAAAKNHAHVAVVVDPADYGPVLAEVQTSGVVSETTRIALAAKAFATTAAYDTAIAAWFAADIGTGPPPEPADAEPADLAVPAVPADAATRSAADGGTDPLPSTLRITAGRDPIALRYGENPHQRAALYRTEGSDPWWRQVIQHSGLALSYLNLYDADAAWLLAHDLARATGQVACAIVKHANPCGAAVASTAAEAYQAAFDCDPRSAFGGIVALSAPIDPTTVERMVAAAQADVVIAPGYGEGVIDALRAKRKNTRLLDAPAPTPDPLHVRPVTGGYLVQEPHRFVSPPESWRVVTVRQPTEGEWADAVLAFRICGWVTSNSIVLVRDGVAWGIGAGQQNRVEAGQIATTKAAGRAAGGACASDAFYPFPDGIEAAAEAGVAVVVQPGRPDGSTRDDEIVAKADELGLAMLFTGERHFLH
jgi:phosphoribosylaminoimidazolecarboxamide formyltransferase/IMP cyclohydrolase